MVVSTVQKEPGQLPTPGAALLPLLDAPYLLPSAGEHRHIYGPSAPALGVWFDLPLPAAIEPIDSTEKQAIPTQGLKCTVKESLAHPLIFPEFTQNCRAQGLVA